MLECYIRSLAGIAFLLGIIVTSQVFLDMIINTGVPK